MKWHRIGIQVQWVQFLAHWVFAYLVSQKLPLSSPHTSMTLNGLFKLHISFHPLIPLEISVHLNIFHWTEVSWVQILYYPASSYPTNHPSTHICTFSPCFVKIRCLSWILKNKPLKNYSHLSTLAFPNQSQTEKKYC